MTGSLVDGHKRIGLHSVRLSVSFPLYRSIAYVLAINAALRFSTTTK